MKKVILTCLIFLLLVISADAIGLRAMKLNNEIFFEPYFEGTYYFAMIPLNEEPMNIEVYVADSEDDGTITNLSKYFKLSDTLFKQVRIRDDTPFSVKISLPAKIKEPGTHKVRVGVRELPNNPGGLAVRTSIEGLFFIQVPFEGKYVRFSVDAENINLGEDIPLKAQFTARGDQAINEIYALIELLDSNGNVVETLKTEKFSLDVNQNKEILLTLPAKKLPAGKYVLRGTVYYDGSEEIITSEVRIGKLDFTITNQTSVMNTGKINEIFVDVESEWADEVDNVYAEIMVVHSPGKEFSVKTLPRLFSGFEKARLQGFFDTSEFEEGEYRMIITLHYGENKKTKETMVSIQKSDLFRMPEFTGSSSQVLFMIIIMMVLIINIILFAILIKKKEKHEKEIEP